MNDPLRTAQQQLAQAANLCENIFLAYQREAMFFQLPVSLTRGHVQVALRSRGAIIQDIQRARVRGDVILARELRCLLVALDRVRGGQ